MLGAKCYSIIIDTADRCRYGVRLNDSDTDSMPEVTFPFEVLFLSRCLFSRIKFVSLLKGKSETFVQLDLINVTFHLIVG